MMTKEEYEKEIVRMWDSVRVINKGGQTCTGVICDECPLHGFKYGCKSLLSTVEVYGAVEKWSKEHPPKNFKVSRMEYDILCTALDYNSAKDTIFDDFYMLNDLLEKGYFKGATLETNVGDYFDNCEVVDK